MADSSRRVSRASTPSISRKRVGARFSCRTSYRLGHRGFTLIELLVVMAVITILTAILFPVFAAAKHSAKKTQCLSNLRQLTHAVQMYADDNNGRYVPAAADMHVGFGGYQRWHGVRETSDSSTPFDPRKGPLWGYLGRTGGIKTCPVLRDSVNMESEEDFERGCGGYGYNAAYVGGTYYRNADQARAAAEASLVSDIRWPSRTIMFTDAALAAPGLIDYPFCEPVFRVRVGRGSGSRPMPSIHFRHNGTTCVAWCDGHVSVERMSFTHENNAYGGDNAASNLGWFGPEDNSLFDTE